MLPHHAIEALHVRTPLPSSHAIHHCRAELAYLCHSALLGLQLPSNFRTANPKEALRAPFEAKQLSTFLMRCAHVHLSPHLPFQQSS